MKLGVILPSRGLIFSETIDEVLRELRAWDSTGTHYELFFSHGNPIPEAFNGPTERILADPTITHIWIVEEDMILPEGMLIDMMSLMTEYRIVTADYPVAPDVPCLTYVEGKVLYGGTGCLLFQRRLLDDMDHPIWSTDKEYTTDGQLLGPRSEASQAAVYGQHDISFYLSLWRNNVAVGVAPQQCGQRKLIQAGKVGINTGTHLIAEWYLAPA